jgi:gliding motility-associated lipoprotein GldB
LPGKTLNFEPLKPVPLLKRKIVLRLCILSLLLASVWGCRETETETCAVIPDVSSIEVDVKFEELHDSLANISSKKDLIALLGRQPTMRDYIFRRSEYPDDSVFINTLYRKFTNQGIDTLILETHRVFGDLSQLKAQFTEAFQNIKYYYPDFVPPKVQTVISGIETDLLVSDSLIIVSLDFYLGEGAKYRPKYYEYLLRRYDPEDIVPSCLLIYGIDSRMNKTDLTDKTVLADMISYGKAFYFAKHMLPCVPDSVFMWYTKEEIDGSRQNEDLIWARLIQDKVLYSTSMIEKRNYLGERPFTSQVGEKCPGRIGQWIGWRIVKQYMHAHSETTLPELMSISDAQALFKESRYKPKRR